MSLFSPLTSLCAPNGLPVGGTERHGAVRHIYRR
jgi:hypothetical protein